MFDKKILCLGNNSLDTDQRTLNLASQDSTVNHGAISSNEFLPELPGYYHTSIIDLSAGEIIKLAKKFNNIVLLDQPLSEWSHETVLKSTISLMINLDQLGLPTKYKDNNNLKNMNFWNKLVTDNKSFCIHPWILMNEIDGKAVLCPRDSNSVTNKPQNIISWQTDTNYQSIRQRMLEGVIIPDHCGICYDYEDKGIESYRQFETKEWSNRLHLNSLEYILVVYMI
jgi:hypothetical protein